MQADQRRTLLGKDQDAGRLAVQPVDQFEELRLRPRLAQLLNDTECDPGTTVNRYTGWLVDDQQVRILEQYGEIGCRYCLPAGGCEASATRIGGMRTTSPICRR